MVDVFTAEKRSEVMARIRSTNTKPEAALYRAIRTILGASWRVERNVVGLPGKPDVLVPSLGVAVFMDGCFFHMCPTHGRIPGTNRDYWEPKLLQNAKRDRAQRATLRRQGYSVWRFWGHDFATCKSTERAIGRLERLLSEKVAEAQS